MKRLVSVAILAICAISGCGTAINLACPVTAAGHPAQVYGGVKHDVEVCQSCKNESMFLSGMGNSSAWFSELAAYLVALDVPLSAVADTLTLPITLPTQLLAEPDASPSRDESPRTARAANREN